MDKNLPNYLTILRLVAIPIIIMSFYFSDSILAHRSGALIFALASITDFLDGFLARKYNLVSKFGTMLDPIVDKVLVGCTLMMLVKFDRADEIPALLILAREFIVAGSREFLAQLRISIPVSNLAKVKTFIQMSAITLLLLGSTGSNLVWLDWLANLLLWLSAVLTLVTGYSYLRAALRHV